MIRVRPKKHTTKKERQIMKVMEKFLNDTITDDMIVNMHVDLMCYGYEIAELNAQKMVRHKLGLTNES